MLEVSSSGLLSTDRCPQVQKMCRELDLSNSSKNIRQQVSSVWCVNDRTDYMNTSPMDTQDLIWYVSQFAFVIAIVDDRWVASSAWGP
jgi:hypothetical protein